MHIVVGGTGHIGGAVAKSLLDAGEAVTIVTHNAVQAAKWRERGAELAEVDICDIASLRRVFQSGRRAFILNPPADPSTDTDVVESQSVSSLLEALTQSGLELVVAQSTYGARREGPCGDLNVLYELEQGLASQPIPAHVVRAAYHFSNWSAGLATARSEGFIDSVLPADGAFPMASPDDIGARCAELMRGDVGDSLSMCEGPKRYSPRDVARVFEQRLGRSVDVRVVAAPDLETWFIRNGFSQPAARSYACMARVTANGEWEMTGEVHRGPTTLSDYFKEI